jgi:hypothetical protein
MAIFNNLLTVFSSVTSLDWLIYAALARLVSSTNQVAITGKIAAKAYRLRVRLGLNVLLWVVLLLFIIQPQWRFSSNTKKVLLVSENVPAADAVQKGQR